ncbi:MAG TPA: crosslink repair DNA glycosylase YcaQ family protein [candidate division Zixibacteria bacterium]|nr:crosslink repair DNA glycosylase YcaQ family protein [candidate division Zixibacteria bacterium]
MLEITKNEARKFILNRLGLRTNSSFSSVLDVVKQIHNIQIDTISVVARAQDLTIFNRMLGYQEKNVWKHLKERELLEFWSHAICLMQIEEYPFYLWRIDYHTKHKSSWWKHWENKCKHIIDRIYNYVKTNGPTKSADFKQKEIRKSTGWWDWKEEKIALEMLFHTGRLLIAYRENFQRYYDLPENVIPSNVSTEKLSLEEVPQHLINIVFSSLGIASVEEIKHYTGQSFSRELWKNNVGKIEAFLDNYVKEDILLEVNVNELENKHYMLAKYNSELKESQKFNFNRVPVKFLTPFDNIIRERSFVQKFWDFDYRIEAYTPVDKRQYGYFSLPILDKYHFIGISDMKVHRKDQMLELKSLFFEKDFKNDDGFIDRFITGLTLFKDFHGCNEIIINHCNYPKLLMEIKEQLTE